MQPQLKFSKVFVQGEKTKIFEIKGSGTIESLAVTNSSGLAGTSLGVNIIIDGATIATVTNGSDPVIRSSLFFERSPLYSSGYFGIRISGDDIWEKRTPNLLNINFAKSIIIEITQYTSTPTATGFNLHYSSYK